MDIPYIVLIIILLLLTYRSFVGYDNICFKTASVIVFLFISLRAPAVGADTWGYYRFFTGLRDYYNTDTRDLEPIFLIYNRVLQVLLFKVGQLYMIANTFFSLSVLYLFVNKYSSKKTLSVLLFFLILPYGIYFVALRQVLGMSAVMFGFWCLLNEKNFKWLLFVCFSLIGWGFHVFSIVGCFIYFISYFVSLPNKKTAYLLVVITAFCGLVLKSLDIVALLNQIFAIGFVGTERLSIYLSGEVDILKEDSVSLFLSMRYSIITLLSLWLMPNEKIKSPLVFVFIIGICIYNLFFEIFLILRIIIPFWIFGIVVLTWGMEKTNARYVNKKYLVNIVIFVIIAYFTQAYIKIQNSDDNSDRLHPYYFFFEDYSNHPSIKMS